MDEHHWMASYGTNLTTCPKLIRDLHLWGQEHQMPITKTTT